MVNLLVDARFVARVGRSPTHGRFGRRRAEQDWAAFAGVNARARDGLLQRADLAFRGSRHGGLQFVTWVACQFCGFCDGPEVSASRGLADGLMRALPSAP